MANTVEIRVPNIGDFQDVPVIEVLVKPGDVVAVEDPLVTLESEKATMEVPAPLAGTVRDVAVRIGDKISEGTLLLALEVAASAEASSSDSAASPAPDHPAAETAGAPAAAGNGVPPSAARDESPGQATEARELLVAPNRLDQSPVGQPSLPTAKSVDEGSTGRGDEHPTRNGAVHASPAVRRFARELGVELGGVRGSGPHDRVTRDDVQSFVKDALAARPPSRSGGGAGAGGVGGLELIAWPKVDFARFGPVERVPLSRIRKLSGPNLQRNWVTIPHVTNHDEADVTELEAFRKALNAEHPGPKVTMLAFVMKAVVAALRAHPDVNSSLDGDALVLKQYYHIGFAADTPGGLVVPVLKDADRKGVLELARETAELAAKARAGKLGLGDMQGATFTISSLGGIGGTGFTPIINAPEVAILGVSRSALRPIWNGTAFVPRLLLPLSLSYDHRVIDGALAARFNVTLTQVLGDLRRAML